MNSRKTIGLFTALLLLPLADAHSVFITPRHSAAAALLPNGDIFITGGVSALPNTKTGNSEIYSTSDSEAINVAKAAMTTARSSHTITVLSNGKVLVAGGFNAAGTPLDSAEIYNPIANTWSGATMTRPRGGHTAALLTKGDNKGDVLLCGGQTLSNPAAVGGITATCEIFSTSGQTFTNGSAMSTPRMGHTASLMTGGRIFVAGGLLYDTGTPVYTPLNEIYDPDAKNWSGAASLNAGRTGHSAVVLNNGNILISGGFNNAPKYAPEETWHQLNAPAQNAGSQGILGDAEMFDPSGLLVPVQKIMPYRNSRHSAVLLPDGTQHIFGGYGNIVPTFFTATPALEPGSRSDNTKVGTSTATINSTSDIIFPLSQKLSSTVDGRIVDGDAFMSLPATAVPSITVANARIYLNRSTAPLDGAPVGRVIGPSYQPGDLLQTLQLEAPAGMVYFDPEPSVSALTAVVTASNLPFTPTPLPSGEVASLDAGASMTVNVTFNVSPFFSGVISGSATITGGTATNSDGSLVFVSTGGLAQLNDTVDANGVVSASLAFTGVTGSITNSTDTSRNTININGRSIDGLTMRLEYAVATIDLSGATYAFDTSTMVIRGMIFSDDLEYAPKTNTWKFGTPFGAGFPVFNHTTLVTPAADMVTVGGQNCESDTTGCRKISPALAPTVINNVYILENESPWSTLGALKTKRASHTSTLLPDGSILTCGGSSGSTPLSSCELMDPITKTWEYTGSMNHPRVKHTATLLPNGTVLVAGGSSGTMGVSTATISAAEIYSPLTKTWLPVKSMAYPRQEHTATLLPDGNVLVTGGSSTSTVASATAEIFTTATSVWSTVAPMNRARAQHTATLLKDGKVLVTGGVNAASGGAIKKAEIYDPAGDAWDDTNDMQKARYNHSANLLKDGKVLVIGGSDNTGSLGSAELYDYPDDLWKYRVDMSSPRANHRSVLLPNGKVMVTGGKTGGIAYDSSESYDPDFDDWKDQNTIGKRSDHTIILMPDGYLLNIGGWDGTQCLDTTDTVYFSYSPDNDGLEPKNRNPSISTGTVYFDRGQDTVYTSSSSNFHGLTEASGGAGLMSSSFSNPRVYIQAMDNPSGFMTDLTPLIYSGANTNWETTRSQLAITMPSAASALPYGWYHVRVAANGQFSPAFPVQVRPLSSSVLPPVSGESSPCNDGDTGTLCGTSDPANVVNIGGPLPNDMLVTLTVPAGAFTGPTRISVSSSAEAHCGALPVEVAIHSAGTQPKLPVTLSMYYSNSVFPGIETTIAQNLNNLVMMRYSDGQCLPLETTIDTASKMITAELDHFSVFQLMIKPAASSVNAIRVYPNPLYINRGINVMTINNMPASAKIRIYTLSGDKIWEGTASPSGDIRWRGVNSAGVTVASGVYLAVIDSSAGKKVLKIAVER